MASRKVNYKVTGISKNTNSFGCEEIQLISSEGNAYKALRQRYGILPKLKPNQIIQLSTNDSGLITNGYVEHGFERIETVYFNASVTKAQRIGFYNRDYTPVDKKEKEIKDKINRIYG